MSGESAWRKRIRLDNGGPAVTYEVDEAFTLYSEWNLSLPEREAGALPLFDWGPGTLRISTGLFQLCARFDGFEGWHEQLFSASNTEDGVQLQPQGWAITLKAALVPGRSATIAWSLSP